MCYYCQRLTLDHQDHLGRSCFDMWHCENWFARLSVLWMVQHRFSRGLRMVYHLEHLYGFSLSEHINSYSHFLLKSLNITWQEKIFDIIHKNHSHRYTLFISRKPESNWKKKRMFDKQTYCAWAPQTGNWFAANRSKYSNQRIYRPSANKKCFERWVTVLTQILHFSVHRIIFLIPPTTTDISDSIISNKQFLPSQYFLMWK